jgi:PEGA domain
VIRGRAAPVAALAGALTAACGPPRVADPTAISAEDAVVTITSTVPDASLWVDGRYIGTIGVLRGGIAIAAGTHRVELRHDDYFSRYAELTVRARERRAITLDLAPRLP